MKTNKLALIIFLSAMMVAVSCDIDNDSPWPEMPVYEGLDDLYLYNVITKVTTMITTSPDTLESYYSFSPDSKKILFMDGSGINEMNSDGSNKHLITGGSSPCYSPDGSKIAFTDGKRLYSINTDGTNKTQNCNTNIGLWYPVWSKDGKQIACSSDSGLCIVTLDGILTVCHVENSVGGWEWSNDSKDIFYSRYISHYATICRYNLVQARESQITFTNQYYFDPKCNPVKNEILFTQFNPDYGVNLVISDQDGTNQQVIVHKDLILTPCWSPTGDKIAFITEDNNLAVIDRSGENYKIINVTPGACVEPKWSNDGNYILYSRVLFLD
jgi:Tol biopolymer transport system component